MGNYITRISCHDECRQKLPNDVYIEILSRLPSKDVGRCMTVCTHWYRLINQPSFIKLHASRAPIIPLLPMTYVHNQRQLKLEQEFSVLSSTGGLLCVKTPTGSFHVYNPTTFKHLRVPDPPYQNKYVGMKLYSTPRTGEFKIVAVSSMHGDQSPWYIMDVGARGYCSPWRMIEVPPCSNYTGNRVIDFDKHHLYDHGAYLSRQSNNRIRTFVEIFTLDVESEQVITMHDANFPWFTNLDTRFPTGQLIDWEGCLALTLYHSDLEEMNVWVLDDYKTNKWRKVIGIPSPYMRDEDERVVIDYVRDGKICCRCSRNVYFLLDIKTKEKQHHDQHDASQIFSTFPYISTLQKLEGMRSCIRSKYHNLELVAFN